MSVASETFSPVSRTEAILIVATSVVDESFVSVSEVSFICRSNQFQSP